jgi:hypothetical protein
MDDDTNIRERYLLVREQFNKLSDDVVLRFLRRSFVQALMQEDLTMSYYCYMATRIDVVYHFQQLLLLLLRNTGSTNDQAHQQPQQQFVISASSPPLLQQSMQICKPFTSDDYKDPYMDPYDAIQMTSSTTDKKKSPKQLQQQRQKDVIRDLVTFILSHSECNNDMTTTITSMGRREQMNQKTTSSPSSFRERLRRCIFDLQQQQHQRQQRYQPLMIHMDKTKITTPLHEVARLGHIALLQCMLSVSKPEKCGPSNQKNHTDLDINAVNGHGRTVLHNVVGGLVHPSNTTTAARYRTVTTNTTAAATTVPTNVQAVGNEVMQNPFQNGVVQNDNTVIVLDPDTHTRTTLQQTTDHRPKQHWWSRTATTTTSIGQRRQRRSFTDDDDISTTNTDDVKDNNPKNPPNHNHYHNNNILPPFGQYYSSDSIKTILSIRIDRLATLQLLLLYYTGSSNNHKNSIPSTATTIADADVKILTLRGCRNTVTTTTSAICAGGEKVSLCAVDTVLNRTDFHYAAELGRIDLCEALLSYDDDHHHQNSTMLTIVDRAGLAPCDVAAQQNHNEVAAYLEARSLLSVDPVEMNTFSLPKAYFAALFKNGNANVGWNRNQLVAPYCCYETISNTIVEQHRERLVQGIMECMDQRVRETRRVPQEHSKAADTSSRGNLLLKNIKQQSKANVHHVSFPDTIQPSISLHEGHVEKLSTYHKWVVPDRDAAFVRDRWYGSKQQETLDSRTDSSTALKDSQLRTKCNAIDTSNQQQQYTCQICFDTFQGNSDEWKHLHACGHGFCTDCLVDYVTECAKSSNSGFVIECPHHKCTQLVSKIDILHIVPPSCDAYERLRRSAIDKFILSAEDYAYCPFPGCTENSAIHVLYPWCAKSADFAGIRLLGAVCTNVQNVQSHIDYDDDDVYQCKDKVIMTYEGVADPRHYDLSKLVQPKLAHRFCFLCGETKIHWPVSCSNLQKWRATMIEYVGEQGLKHSSDVSVHFKDVAQKIWIEKNTRPCPEVRSCSRSSF